MTNNSSVQSIVQANEKKDITPEADLQNKKTPLLDRKYLNQVADKEDEEDDDRIEFCGIWVRNKKIQQKSKK